jgi:hypothetical protein
MSPIICPHCNQPINDEDALKCLFCGESLNRTTGFMSFMQNKAVLVFVGTIVIISFLILIMG